MENLIEKINNHFSRILEFSGIVDNGGKSFIVIKHAGFEYDLVLLGPPAHGYCLLRSSGPSDQKEKLERLSDWDNLSGDEFMKKYFPDDRETYHFIVSEIHNLLPDFKMVKTDDYIEGITSQLESMSCKG